MADDEVATKAPESDMQADSAGSALLEDTRAQSGPTMGDHCTSDRPLDASRPPPAGELTTLNDVAVYISKPAAYPHNPGKLLLLLTGGTGLHSVNNQLQADAYAARGFLVVMPDQFSGDPAPNTSHVDPGATDAAIPPSIIERVKMGAAETAKSFLIDMWLARHTPEKVLPVLHRVLDGAKEQFADAVANGNGIYGAGYCFGAKYVLLMLGEHTATATWGRKAEADEEKGDGASAAGPLLKVGAIAHGTDVTREDLEAVKRPVCMACVEGDQLFPDEVREQGRASLELNKIDNEIRVFSGVPHGFAVAGDYGEEHIKQSQAKAFEMMCKWLEAR